MFFVMTKRESINLPFDDTILQNSLKNNVSHSKIIQKFFSVWVHRRSDHCISEMVNLPEPKPAPQFRKYEEDPKTELEKRVKNFYYQQHRLQTVDFVSGMVRSFRCRFNFLRICELKICLTVIDIT